jgi:hypothetical protein
MSNTGNFSGNYKIINQVAEMVDCVLLGTSDTASAQRLGQLLIDLASKDKNSHRAQFLDMTFRRMGITDHQKWEDVGNALLRDTIGENEKNFLERVAKILEQEQINSLARMQGEL